MQAIDNSSLFLLYDLYHYTDNVTHNEYSISRKLNNEIFGHKIFSWDREGIANNTSPDHVIEKRSS